MGSSTTPTAPSMMSSTATTVFVFDDFKGIEPKKHGLYCRFFNKTDEELDMIRKKKAAKEEKKREKYCITPEEFEALQNRMDAYEEEQKKRNPLTTSAKQENTPPVKMKKAHNFSGLKGKNVMEHIRSEVGKGGIW